MKLCSTAHLAVLLAALAAANPDALATDPPGARRVLVLYSFRHGLAAHDGTGANEMVNRGIRTVFASSATDPIHLHIEYLDVSALPEERCFERSADDFREKYRESSIDVIIAVNYRSLSFLLEHGDNVFPGCPIVFCGVEKRRVQARGFGPNVTGVLGEATFGETIAVALRLLPDTERVFVVVGTAETETFIEAVAREEFEPYRDKLEFRYPTDRSLNGVIDEVANLPENTFVLFLTLPESGSSDTAVPSNAVTLLSQASRVPTFGTFDTYMGYGIVGGDLYSFEIRGRTAAELVLRVLDGERPADIPLVDAGTSGGPMFDWRELRRWGIPEERLPPGSIVRYKELSFGAEHKWRIIGVLTLCVAQALLIIGLLELNRRRRRRAERSLADRLEFEAFVAELSTAFGKRDTAGFGERITQWLPRVANVVGADRCALLEFSRRGARARVIHAWASEDVELAPVVSKNSNDRKCLSCKASYFKARVV